MQLDVPMPGTTIGEPMPTEKLELSSPNTRRCKIDVRWSVIARVEVVSSASDEHDPSVKHLTYERRDPESTLDRSGLSRCRSGLQPVNVHPTPGAARARASAETSTPRAARRPMRRHGSDDPRPHDSKTR